MNYRTPVSLCWLMGTIAGIAVDSAPDAGRQGTSAEALLQHRMTLSAAELRDLRAGAAIVKSLESARHELAHLGVVGIRIPSDEFIRRFRDIERFERGPGTPQIGRFSEPPRLEDLSALTLSASDVRALQTCRPGDCDLKLSASGMARVRREVNWTSPDAMRQANETMRRLLLDLLLAYRARGDEALGNYDDGANALPIAGAFKALLAETKVVPVPIEGLLKYLSDFPRNRPANVEEFFYWSVVEFGLKPTIRLNHVVIYPVSNAHPTVTHVVATKQVYASHYFHTTLELRFLINRSAPDGFYLTSVLRSRNDGMTGLTGSLLRPIISRRSRTGIRRYLEYVKRQVEQ